MFKVIVIGGGPSGLTAAHALYRAGIDFVVLERSSQVGPDVGASLVLGPQSLRIFHQLGLLDRLMALGGELGHVRSFTRDGVKFGDSTRIQEVKENFGLGLVSFHRAELIRALYDGLPDEAQQKFMLNKKVADITCDEDGVRVKCADDTVYEGSVVVGADGVHSMTRQRMRQLALQQNDQVEWDSEIPFTSEYRCMWCSFPRPVQCGEATETQSEDRSIMFLNGRDRGWIFLYEKLPQPTKERISYSNEDLEEYATSFAEWAIDENLKVKDVWAERMTAGMANLEEGVLQHWTWGRIALVGDACHKYTPNAGQGFNNGIQDIVALCNGLKELIASIPQAPPSIQSIREVFLQYQALRQPEAKHFAQLSGWTTRLHAWNNWIYWALARFVMPFDIIQNILLNYVQPKDTKRSLILKYVNIDARISGKVGWENN